MNKFMTTAAVLVALIAPAYAASTTAYKTMPINFVGDWCYSSLEKNTTWYALPSWTEGGHCTKILSINEGGFFYDDGSLNCDPVKVRVKMDVAPSGPSYIATITASCYPDGPVAAGKLQTFEFYRYKGNMSVTRR